MNLHGKLLLRKDKFYQQRERSVTIGASARPIGRHVAPNFSQLFSCKGARSKATFATGHPCLAEWFGLEVAREKINPAQVALLDRLQERQE